MSRLTERQTAGYDLIEMKGAWCDSYCREQSEVTCRDCAIWKGIQKLAYYEDLEEQGFKMVNIDKVVEQLEEESWSVGCSFAPKENRTANIKTEKAIEIVKGGTK